MGAIKRSEERVRDNVNRSGLWGNIGKTYRYVRPWRASLIKFAVISVVEAIIGIVVPMLSAQIILDITDNKIDQLIFTALTLLGVSIIMSVCGYFEDLSYRRLTRGMLVGMQIDVARETMKIETCELDQNIRHLGGDACVKEGGTNHHHCRHQDDGAAGKGAKQFRRVNDPAQHQNTAAQHGHQGRGELLRHKKYDHNQQDQ